MKTLRLVFVSVLLLALGALSAPASAEGPFIEYQDVPVYVDGYGYCVLRKTTITMPSGDTYYDEQLIC